MVDPSTLRSERVVCASSIMIKLEKNLGDIQKIFYEEQGEGLYPGELFQRARGTVQTSNQNHNQVSVEESPKNMQ